MNKRHEFHQTWVFVCSAIVLLVAATLAHSSGLTGAFVFDDVPEIVESERLREPIQVRELFQSRGLGYITLKLNYLASELEPRGYHLFNLAVHLAASLVFWAVLVELLVIRRHHWHPAIARHAELIAWSSALLWSVHPITTQAVVYTIQRLESLWSLAFLVGLASYLAAIRQTSPRRRWIGLTIAVVVFWMGMLCKEPLAVALVVLPICDRLFGACSPRQWFRERGVFYAVLAIPVLMAIPVVVLPSILSSDKTASGGLYTQVVTPMEYWRTQPEVLLLYVSKILVPIRQCFDYGWPPQDNVVRWLASTVFVINVLAVSLRACWRGRAWSCFSLFFFACTATTCLVPLIDLAVEHRVYVASSWLIAGGLAGVTVIGSRFCESLRIDQLHAVYLARFLIGLLTVTLAWLTHERSSMYESPLSLWQDTAMTAPWNFRAHVNVASEQLKRDEPKAAIANCQLALGLPSFDRQPDHQQAKVHDLLASALSNSGDIDAAVIAAEKAVALTPGGSDHWMRLASVYTQHSMWTSAEAALRRAIANRPKRAVLYEHLATVQMKTAQWRSAKESLERAKTLGASDSSDIHRRISELETRLDRAASSADVRIEEGSGDAAAWVSAGNTYRVAGDDAQAARSYARAVELDGRNSAALNNLGAMISASDPARAESILRRAVEVDPANVQGWHSLGNALVRLERLDEAVECYRQALVINPSFEPSRQTLEKISRAVAR